MVAFGGNIDGANFDGRDRRARERRERQIRQIQVFKKIANNSLFFYDHYFLGAK